MNEQTTQHPTLSSDTVIVPSGDGILIYSPVLGLMVYADAVGDLLLTQGHSVAQADQYDWQQLRSDTEVLDLCDRDGEIQLSAEQIEWVRAVYCEDAIWAEVANLYTR